ncbi:MAG: calycin-like domain-containing protein [Prevotella sp.]|nr:calycin-like domain-containing protein [Prevotella sp.]MBS7207855.1 calycin-like domain-containing protein [Prevotella sp.]
MTVAQPWVFVGGTKWSNASSYASGGDGGSHESVAFSNRPDALTLRYKKEGAEISHIIAYLWEGTFKSYVPSSCDKKGNQTFGTQLEDVDRVVMGRQDDDKVLQKGTLIASLDEEITSVVSTWNTVVLPLNYKTTTVVPTKMNVVLAASDYWTRSNLKGDTKLYVDDVDFVYYSTLTSLKAGSKTIALKDGVYNYTVTGKMPTKKEVVATCKSQFADATVAVDAANYKVTVTVTNQGGKDVDGATQHVYTLQYTAPVVKQYAGILNVEMAGEDVIANATQKVTISYYNDNTCDFSLPNFMFMGDDIGNIEIPNVKVSEDAAGTKTFTDGEVEAMKLAGGDIVAHVVLNGGTITSAGVINMPITVGWMPGYPNDKEPTTINVLFSSDKKVEVTEAGYYYVVKGDDYQHPLVEHQTTMLKSVKYGDMNGFTYTLSLDGVNAGGINFGDMAVAGLDNTDEQYSGTDSAVALGNGKTASVTVDGGKNATTGKYEVKFATTVDGQLYNIVFTTDDSSSSVNDVEASGAAVRGAEGAIVVEGFAGRVNVYTVDGRLAASAQIDGEATIIVAAGLYVVRAGEKAVKVVVK